MAGAETDTHQFLRVWRKRQSKTLENVSELIGSKVNTISGWENGKRRVNLDDLSRLAAIYGVTAADLLQSPQVYEQRQASSRLVGIANRLTPDQSAHLFWLAEEIAPVSPRPAELETPSHPFRPGGSVTRKDPIKADCWECEGAPLSLRNCDAQTGVKLLARR